MQLPHEMATRTRPTSPTAVYVSIVSNNPDTIDGLQLYFKGAGIPSHCTRTITDIEMVAPSVVTATVLFPDDFATEKVLALIRDLRRSRPRVFALLITCEPQRYRAVVEANGLSLPPLVLPKPSFGWDILDAIRAHAGGS